MLTARMLNIRAGDVSVKRMTAFGTNQAVTF